jgi:UDP-N-acetylmuramate dehydrogenase
MEIKTEVLLRNISHFKIGEKVAYFSSPHNLEELCYCLNFAKQHGIPVKVIGNMSNILIQRKYLNMIIIKLNSSYFKDISIRNGIINVGAGVELKSLIKFCIKEGLSGLEFLIGVPATVGGVVASNAGAFGVEVSNLISRVCCLNKKGEIIWLEKKDIDFWYRGSDLKDKIVIEVEFKLEKKSHKEVKEKARDFFKKRIVNQDLSFPSLGCVFKNTTFEKTGKIIDIFSLKGRKRGGAAISLKHANFIVNFGSAIVDDFLSLKDMIQRKVLKEKNLWLELEIEIW